MEIIVKYENSIKAALFNNNENNVTNAVYTQQAIDQIENNFEK